MPFKGQETIKGFGVIKGNPWHLAGVYQSKPEAVAKAAEMGEGYEVKWGENRKGTDDFVFIGT
jgi:hypothetical protein